MYPGKVLGNAACFVALDWANEVPFQVWALSGLLDAFLGIVFAKGFLTTGGYGINYFNGEGFGNRQQLNATSCSTGCSFCGMNSLP